MWNRPRETSELMPIDVTVDGVLTTNFQVAVIPKYGTRPVTGFVAATVVSGQGGASVSALAPGDYWAFPKVGGTVLAPIWFRIT